MRGLRQLADPNAAFSERTKAIPLFEPEPTLLTMASHVSAPNARHGSQHAWSNHASFVRGIRNGKLIGLPHLTAQWCLTHIQVHSQRQTQVQVQVHGSVHDVVASRTEKYSYVACRKAERGSLLTIAPKPSLT